MKDETNNNRRDFLRKGLAFSLITAGGAALSAFQHQHHEESETGKKVKLLSPDGKVVEVDSAYLKPVPEVEISLENAREGIPDRRFVMVIDLARCKNQRKCADACEAHHKLTPDKEWIKVLKMKDNDISSPYWQPTMCYHCDQPPCVKVCPVDATYKRSDGLVLVDTDRCVGCRFCMVACPYSARVFDWEEPDLPAELMNMPYSPENSFPPKKGTVSKCDFCPHHVKMGHMPHCVSACPNGVFYFGDENEDAVSNGSETVRLSTLLRDRSGYRHLEEMGTKPRVYYLPPVNRLFPFEEEDNTGKIAEE